MRLTQFLKEEMIILDLASEKKEDVIEELVSLFPIDERAREILIDTLLNREKLGSTGVGRGIAIPHCRSLVVDRLMVAIGRSRRGLEFGSLDGKPVRIVFLLCAPPQPKPIEYLLTLGRVAELSKEILKNPRLFETDDRAEFMKILIRCEEHIDKGAK